MPTIQGVAFPEGRLKALTLSYDDGVIADRRLVEIMNRHGVRGSFHLNGGIMGSSTRTDRLPAEEVSALFSGHEISAHGYTHPFLEKLPGLAVVREMLEDRKALEAIAGYPVRGMSYPFGTYSDSVVEILKQVGITYARTVNSTGNFNLPTDLLRWHPTCHHKNDLIKKTEEFLAASGYRLPVLFYVWGHSYEFNNDNNWELIENFCELIGGKDEIWYATNIEIADYLTAFRRLEFSAECHWAFNPSAQAVWIRIDGRILRLPGGEITGLFES